MSITVEVVSDVICPWCYIGKRRLEKAISSFEKPHEVKVHWTAYQMNPAMPPEGISRRDYRTRKFGTWERSLELDAQVIAAGKSEGIHFAFDKVERTPNTFDAHRLIWLGEQRGMQDAVVEALFHAYFTDARDISSRPVLMDVVVEAGIERAEVEALLNSDQGSEAVLEEDDRSKRLGVATVPFFIINGEINFAGAQPTDAFLSAFNQTYAPI